MTQPFPHRIVGAGKRGPTMQSGWRRFCGGAAAIVLAAMVASCGQPSDEQLAESVEKGMMEVPGAEISFPVMKREFPHDYQLLISRMVGLARRNAGKEEAQTVVRDYMNDFIKRIGPDAAKAPTAELLEFRDANVAMLKVLKRQSDAYCADAAMGRNLDPEGPGRGQRLAVARTQAAYFTAAAAGRRNPVERAKPSQSDFAALRTQLFAHGMSEADIELLGNTPRLDAAAPAEQCRIGIATYSALADVPGAASERLTVLMVVPAE